MANRLSSIKILKGKEMSDSYSKYYEDIDDYLALCKKYKEKPVFKSIYDDPFLMEADVYGVHAEELRARHLKEQREEMKK